MENNMGKVCPICNAQINAEDAVIVCPACSAEYHAACYQAKGCATPGCPQQIVAAEAVPAQEPVAAPAEVAFEPAPATAYVCTNCGTALEDTQAFCPNCGAPKMIMPAPQVNRCNNCGTELMPGQEFCPNCGQKANLMVDSGVNNAINQFNNNIAQKSGFKLKTPHIIAIAGGAVALIVVILIVVLTAGGGKKGPDFQQIYDTYCSSIWADVGSDGSYLSIDTNPYDWDDDGLAYPKAYDAVKSINKALGLPESLTTEIGETRGADGKQTESFPSQGVIVSWTYHPDEGLEITYRQYN